MTIVAANWSRRVQITEIATSPALSGYVALLTESNLPAEIWTTAINGGGDLRVCLNSDGSSQLPLEVVSFDTVSETAVLWVRFPTFTSGDSLWLFYGKAGETQPTVTDTFGRNSVWLGYALALHDGYNDSSGNASIPTTTSGTPTPTSSGLELVNSSVEFNSDGLVGITQFSVSSDFTLTELNTGSPLWLMPNTSSREFKLDVASATNFELRLFKDNSGGDAVVPVLQAPQLTAVYDEGVSVTAYKEGIIFGTPNWAGSNQGTFDSRFEVGTNLSNIRLNSLYIREGLTGADYIATEYANQSSPNTFWSTGTPEDTGGGGGTLVITSIAIASAESFGTPVLTAGAVTLSPETIASAEALGNPTISQQVQITPLSINTEEFVGNPIVTPQGVIITPVEIPTEALVGNPEVSVGLAFILPEEIATQEFVGEPDIDLILKQIFPDAIASLLSVGRPLVLGGDRIIIPIESRVTWNAVAKYLRELVFTGADNDVIMKWLRSEGFDDAYNDNWEQYLKSAGFLSGAMSDKYALWRRGINGVDPWILSDGTWDDSKIWQDLETWRDS